MPASNAVIWFAAIGLFFSTDVVVAAESQDATLVTRTTPDAIELAVPASALVLQIPKGGLAAVEETKSGAQTSPRYFHLEDRSRGLNVSGWFEPAAAFKGFETFWNDEFSAMKRSGLAPTAPPTPVVLGDWSATVYEIPLPAGAAEYISTHIRAELLKAGTWIDLHISITARRPLADARDEALVFLKSIEVKVKQ